MEDREYLALKLAYLTSFEHIRVLTLKIKTIEELWENKEPIFHTWYAQEINKVISEDEALKKLRDEIKAIEMQVDK